MDKCEFCGTQMRHRTELNSLPAEIAYCPNAACNHSFVLPTPDEETLMRKNDEYRRALEFIARMAVMGPYVQARFEAMGQIALDALHGLPPDGSPYET